MRYFIVFSILMLVSVVFTTSAYACGGGAPLMLSELSNADTIVYATVLDVDDRGYNAILRVNQYFKGSESAFLTVMRWKPALETTADLRGYDTSCVYDGGGTKWIVGSTGYFGLFQNGNGTFTDTSAIAVESLHFFEQEGSIMFYENTSGTFEQTSMAVEEFEAYLLELGHRESPVEPDFEASRYPLMRFLTITTENGTHYQLNPDRSVIEVNTEEEPIAISEDSSHLAFRIDDEYVGFQYLYLTRQSEERGDGGWLKRQPGRWVIFSPNSNFVTVWDETQLTVYMFDNYESAGYGQAMGMQVIAHHSLSWADTDRQPHIVWSGDSSTIAYEDKEGLWIWNIFEKTEPELVVNDDFAPLLDLSRSGRYVRFGLETTWILLDTRTGQTFDNAVITPDESNLIFINAGYPENTLDLNRGGETNCQVPLMETCPILIQHEGMQDWFWYRNDVIALLSCYEDRCHIVGYPWQLAIKNLYGDRRLEAPLPLVNALAYDAENDQPVVAVDGYTLEFGFYPTWERDEPGDGPFDGETIDLSDLLDSPIVDLDWGQSIFFEEVGP